MLAVVESTFERARHERRAASGKQEGILTRRDGPLLALTLVAVALAPDGAAALVRDVGHSSGLPLSVEPSAPLVQHWIDGEASVDGTTLAMTLSDGGRWRRDALPPGQRYSMGGGMGRFSAALQLGPGNAGLALQWDFLRNNAWMFATSASAQVGSDEEYDIAFVPLLAMNRRLNSWLTLAPFGALRVRWGQTHYEVQGWSADRSTPFATAHTSDLALAPLAGIAAVARYAELRLTAGWELYLVNRLVWEERATAIHRAGGPFAVLALRLRLGSDR